MKYKDCRDQFEHEVYEKILNKLTTVHFTKEEVDTIKKFLDAATILGDYKRN